MKKTPSIVLRIPHIILEGVQKDLKRQHAYAWERVGFIKTRLQKIDKTQYVLIVTGYDDIPDEQYIPDSSVGARINSDALMDAMQRILNEHCGQFHIHMHGGKGVPAFSGIDLKELPPVIDTFRVDSEEAHGIIVMSDDSLTALAWIPGIAEPVYADRIVIVDNPMTFIFPANKKRLKRSTRYDRQSFLGKYSQSILETVRVGVVGAGGGGSHVVQQLAHLGVKNYTIFDPDRTSNTNLNRLVGATYLDARKRVPKVKIAERVIKALQPDADVKIVKKPWQDQVKLLYNCDIVFAGVDTYMERNFLEASCRRYCIPLIDIGMDIYQNKRHEMRGQIILSTPGDLCMQCYGYLTSEKLEQEARQYGDIGGRPQVVWSNGILASGAIGVFVDILTNWSGRQSKRVYIAYDGNENILQPHIYQDFSGTHVCLHYALGKMGPPQWRPLTQWSSYG